MCTDEADTFLGWHEMCIIAYKLRIYCIWDWGFWIPSFFVGRFWTQCHFVWGEIKNKDRNERYYKLCMLEAFNNYMKLICMHPINFLFWVKVELRYLYLPRVSCRVISRHQGVGLFCVKIILFYILQTNWYIAILLNPNWNMM